jgi:hypothetical protein
MVKYHEQNASTATKECCASKDKPLVYQQAAAA